MSHNFDLEEKIMDCWKVVDDIKFICEEYYDDIEPMNPDKMANLLLGMEEMYKRKFERLWNDFENASNHGGIYLSESEVLMCKQHRDYDRKLNEMIDDDSRKWNSDKIPKIKVSHVLKKKPLYYEYERTYTNNIGEPPDELKTIN